MPPPTTSQKLAVMLAFFAAALSLSAAASSYFKEGQIDALPIFGGLFMLSLGISGYLRVRNPQ
jgi:hypothetical protein